MISACFLRLAPVCAALILTGCAASQDYPSLEYRPQERITGTANVANPPPVAVETPNLSPLSADLAARLQQLVDQARSANQRFASHEARAHSAVNAGGNAAAGSESWATATIALSMLESARSEGMVALAELDALYAAERTTRQHADSLEGSAIETARNQVIEWIENQDSTLAALRGRMRH